MKLTYNYKSLVFLIILIFISLWLFSPILHAKESFEFLLKDILNIKVTSNNLKFQYSIAIGIDDDNKKVGYIVEWRNLVTNQSNVTINYNSFTNGNVNLLFNLMQTGVINEIKKQIGKFIIVENSIGFNIYDKNTKDPLKYLLISNLKLDLLYEIKGRSVSIWTVDNLERILIIQTSEKGASIYINGKFVGLSPLKITFKGRVSITIRVEKEGYSPQEISITLKKTGENKINIDLGPFDNFERILKIKSYPSIDSKVYYNNVLIGSTPLTFVIKGKTSGYITLKKNNLSISTYFDGSKSGEYEIPIYFDAEIRKITILSNEKDSILIIEGKPIDFLPFTFEYYGEKYFIGQIKTKSKMSSPFLIYANPNETKVIKISLSKSIVKKTYTLFQIIQKLFKEIL